MSESTKKPLVNEKVKGPDDPNSAGTGSLLLQVQQHQQPDAKDLERKTETQSPFQKEANNALPGSSDEKPLNHDSNSEKKNAPRKAFLSRTTASAASASKVSASGQNASSPIKAGVPAFNASDSSEASLSSLSGENKQEELLAQREKSKKNRRSKDGNAKLSTNANRSDQGERTDKQRPLKKRKTAPHDQTNAGKAENITRSTTNNVSSQLPNQRAETGAPFPGFNRSEEMNTGRENTDEARLAAKREYNRRNAARARKREKDKVAELHRDIEALKPQVDTLRSHNTKLKAQKQCLEDQNRQLTQQQQQYLNNQQTSLQRNQQQPIQQQYLPVPPQHASVQSRQIPQAVDQSQEQLFSALLQSLLPQQQPQPPPQSLPQFAPPQPSTPDAQQLQMLLSLVSASSNSNSNPSQSNAAASTRNTNNDTASLLLAALQNVLQNNN